ncbi:MAG: hypothetical protein HY053_03870 [Proteobacteria bacterium]|nr:hypothetical protein [Pseudomonadota bacterium]
MYKNPPPCTYLSKGDNWGIGFELYANCLDQKKPWYVVRKNDPVNEHVIAEFKAGLKQLELVKASYAKGYGAAETNFARAAETVFSVLSQTIREDMRTFNARIRGESVSALTDPLLEGISSATPNHIVHRIQWLTKAYKAMDSHARGREKDAFVDLYERVRGSELRDGAGAGLATLKL